MGNKITAPELIRMKERSEKITMLTAYDFAWGKLIDEAGIDVALVGDSLGMVVFGHENTLQVTMEDMIRHTQAVARGAKNALVVTDMPFMSYQVNDDEALRNAGRLMIEGGASAVKLEDADHIITAIEKMVTIGIPVVGHLGMTPQSIQKFGGFKTQGADDEAGRKIFHDALALEEAGASAVVLEKIPSELAQRITERLMIPTIGIGAGPDCDGQVLVAHDILGMYDSFMPPFAKKYADVRTVTLNAFKAYAEEVRTGKFPEVK